MVLVHGWLLTSLMSCDPGWWPVRARARLDFGYPGTGWLIPMPGKLCFLLPSINFNRETHTQTLTSCWFREKTASFAWVHCQKSSYTPIRKTLLSSLKLLCSKSCLVFTHGKLEVGDEQEKSVSEPMWHRVAVRTGGLCTRWSEVQRVPESASWLWSLGRAAPKHP